MGIPHTIKIGQQRNGLELLEKISKDNRVTQFRCRCTHCNNETVIRPNKFGYIQSCGCLKRRKLADHWRFGGHGEIHKGKWNTYVDNARSRDIPFKITIQYVWKLFLEQNRRCALTGEPIHMWENGYTKRSTASLDRINNKKGYVKGNVHWVHKCINQIKMAMTLEDFKSWCRKVVEHDKNN